MELKDLYAKYNILSDGLHRVYVMSVFERRHDLESSYPVELIMSVPGGWEDAESTSGDIAFTKRISSEKSWVRFTMKVAKYLQSKSPKVSDDLLAFKCEWSRSAIFTSAKSRINEAEIEPGIYLNLNHTSVHCAWLIADLLRFYGIEKGYFLIHMSPQQEPEEIRKHILAMRKEEFRMFLINSKGKTEEKANKIVKNVEALNRILSNMGTTYDNFFLFDSAETLSNYKSKAISDSPRLACFTEEQMVTVRRCLDYLTDYYSYVKKKSAANMKDLEFNPADW